MLYEVITLTTGQEHFTDNGECVRHRIGPEKYPGKRDHAHREGHLESLIQPGCLAWKQPVCQSPLEMVGGVFQNQYKSMQSAPDHKCPVRSVPQTADHKGNKNIVPPPPYSSHPVAAQWNIYIRITSYNVCYTKLLRLGRL